MSTILSKYRWYSAGNIKVTGFIRLGSRYLRNSELAEFFSGATEEGKFDRLLKSANGQFSVIIQIDKTVFAACDRLRNYPLFYTKDDSGIIITDDCYSLIPLLSKVALNRQAVISFLSTGYVINNQTLIEKIFQIEAGAYVKFGESVTGKFYHDPRNEITRNFDLKDGAKELKDLFSEVFKGHLQALSDRFIAVPLSGGFDSRLVAIMVARFHPERVLCYTYGIETNPEILLAEKVAKKLGLKWIKIIYDSDLIKDFVTDPVFRNYYPFASGLTSMFFLQEYFAVKFLKDNKLVPDDTVFLPGFSGDMLAGSFIFPRLKKNLKKKKLAKIIYTEFFRHINNKVKIKSEAIRLIGERIPKERLDACKVFDTWYLKERDAKFIVNSAKVFLYFGYKYVMPLWDNNLIDFCLNLPVNLRLNRILYECSLKEHIFREADVNFADEINPPPWKRNFYRIKERFKPLLPAWVKKLFFNSKSGVFYDEFVRRLMSEYRNEQIISPKRLTYYNAYLSQWYLLKTKELFKIKD